MQNVKKKEKRKDLFEVSHLLSLSEILVAGLFQARKRQMEKDTGKSFKMFLNYSDSNNKEGGKVKVC